MHGEKWTAFAGYAIVALLWLSTMFSGGSKMTPFERIVVGCLFGISIILLQIALALVK